MHPALCYIDRSQLQLIFCMAMLDFQVYLQPEALWRFLESQTPGECPDWLILRAINVVEQITTALLDPSTNITNQYHV